MHPLLGRRGRLALYALAWLALGVLLAGALVFLLGRPVAIVLAFALPLAVVYGFVVLSAWWVCRARPLTGQRLAGAVLAQLLAAIQSGAAWAVLGAMWAVALNRFAHAGFTRSDFILLALGLLATGVPLYLLSAVVHYLVIAFEASHAAERRVLESHVTAREAELRALRAQINPHFLFNSLNSINALVGSDPEGARRMCEGLGDFMRRTLTLGALDHVALSEELELVDRYLAIEQVRFGRRLQVERHLDPQALPCAIPPLLLQPLVENAIKHGVAGRIEGGTIRIEARRNGDALGIAVENPVDADAPPVRGAGMGLDNVRRRLEAFGARGARLDAVREATSFRVTLTLPANGGEGPRHD